MPENTQPNPPEQQPEPEGTARPDTEAPANETATTDTDATDETAGREQEEQEAPGATETETGYERTAEGHRVTRRTVRRREVSEDTEETITETYPVPHQPPTPTSHPAPVG